MRRTPELAVLAWLTALASACASDLRTEGGDPSADGDAGPDGGAGPGELPAGTEPYGAEALTAFDRLANLRLDTIAGQESSYDRSGANVDGLNGSNFLYVDGAGEKVMADLVGPGAIYTMWFTGFDPATAWLKVYVDGEPSPRLDRPLRELVDGVHPPFEWPLALDADASSGGFVVQVPIPFARSVRVTTNGAGAHFFYHVGYHLLSPAREVVSFTGGEDLSAARAVWDTPGGRPTSTASGEETKAGTIDVPANGSATLADLTGAGRLTTLSLRVPGLIGGQRTDDGRAHGGRSSFRMRIHPGNQGVVLRRRLDGNVPDQRAEVSIDGAVVGRWETPGSAPGWRDAEFVVPPEATAGKSAIDVAVVESGSAIDWSEFEYRAFATIGGRTRLTDVLDVGQVGSEAAHGYQIEGETFRGRRTYEYPGGGDGRALLDRLRLRVTWDDEAAPAIDAPLGSFFAVGAFGPATVTALPVGMDSSGLLYVHFPMPFASRARVEIVSAGPAVSGVEYEVGHAPLDQPFERLGHFRAAYRQHDVGADGRDLSVLDTGGRGHLVGLVASVSGPLNRLALEGDERFYVDGSRSPSFHGTGSGDLFHGGWNFDRGTFARGTHGNPLHKVEGGRDLTVGYRLFLADPIPFRNGIRAGIEHGQVNDVPVAGATLAWYYQKPGEACPVSDELDVGDPPDEAAHAYVAVDGGEPAERDASFEGDDDTVTLRDSVRATAGSSFTLTIDPANAGVLLRRRFDQTTAGSVAEVWVDGARVGAWSRAGANAAHAWREHDFFIPPRHTAAKASLAVEIRVPPGAPAWSEARYWAMSCRVP